VSTTNTNQQQTDRCIKDCAEVVRLASRCADECLGGGQGDTMSQCVRLCLDCVDLATTCMELLGRNSQFAAQLCGVCAEACTVCAKECDTQQSGGIMHKCAEACRSCSESCRQMAA